MFTVPHCHKNCTSLSSHSLLVRVDSLGAHSGSRHASQHFCSDPKGSCLDPYILSAPHDTMVSRLLRLQHANPDYLAISSPQTARIPRLSRGVRRVPSTCRLSLRGHYSYLCRTATRRPASGWLAAAPPAAPPQSLRATERKVVRTGERPPRRPRDPAAVHGVVYSLTRRPCCIRAVAFPPERAGG